MVPAGYMAKRVHKKADRFESAGVTDMDSMSGCISPDFADYIDRYWKHNGFWLFHSTELIREIATKESADLVETSLFYYEVYESEFDGEKWHAYGNVPEHSPLSATLSRAKFAPMPTVCLAPLTRPKHISSAERSTTPNRARIESSQSTRWAGPDARLRHVLGLPGELVSGNGVG